MCALVCALVDDPAHCEGMDIHTEISELEKRHCYALTTTQVADFLGVDRRTLVRALESGTIPSITVGRTIRVPLEWVKRALALSE